MKRCLVRLRQVLCRRRDSTVESDIPTLPGEYAGEQFQMDAEQEIARPVS